MDFKSIIKGLPSIKGIIESGIGHTLVAMFEKHGDKIIEKILYEPPRPILLMLIHKINNKSAREKLIDMIEEADKKGGIGSEIPSENVVVSSLCKYISLMKRTIEFHNDKTGRIESAELLGYEEEEIIAELERLGKIALKSEKRFWTEVNILINDVWAQRMRNIIRFIKKNLIPLSDEKSRQEILRKIKEVETEIRLWNERQKKEDKKALRRFRRKIKKTEEEIQAEQRNRKIRFLPKIR